MTVAELLKKGTSLLEKNKIDNYINEARWIFESALKCNRDYFFFHSDDEVDIKKEALYIELINRRVNGEPVQYIIGSWDFYGDTFYVGKGVLIPRPETEMLVDFAIEYLKGKSNPVVFDLCSGSGCIGISVANNISDSQVYLLEKSDDAFLYLENNLIKSNCKNAYAVKGDIFEGFLKYDLPKPDLILSNPPYIESNDISSLQSEVLFEPVMALDGGNDGLDFYRAIEINWLPYCKGAIAVECGEGQTRIIENVFSSHCPITKSLNDFNGLDRVVIGYIDTERKTK